MPPSRSTGRTVVIQAYFASGPDDCTQILRHYSGAKNARTANQFGSGSPTRELQAHTDRTAHPRAAEPAVPIRVLVEILLMVALGVVERRRLGDLRRDATVAG